MKYTLDSICGPPVVKRGPYLKPKSGIEKELQDEAEKRNHVVDTRWVFSLPRKSKDSNGMDKTHMEGISRLLAPHIHRRKNTAH